MTLRVAAFTGGVAVPSARFRVRQYIVPLADQGIMLDEMGHGSGGRYPPAGKWQRPLWAASRLSSLVPEVVRSHGYDAVLLQREMVSSFSTLEAFTGKPRLFDVDDSIHLLRGGSAARRIAVSCDRVIVGNDYLAEWYARCNSSVCVVPTAVDTDRFAPIQHSESEQLTIGWIGTSANFPYLAAIEPALASVMADRPGVRVFVMADRPPAFTSLDSTRWQFSTWNEADEIAAIQAMDIGLMPLSDDPWTRGKCSFKMLQYMACGIPVVVSPVGMNAQVLAQGQFGIGAQSTSQWIEALHAMADSVDMRRRLGGAGRAVVEEHYSVRVIAPRLAQILRGD
jgi:glycosyltransferase involved in cell wall biosynthesis